MTNEIDVTELLPDGTPRYNKLASGAVVDKTTNRIVSNPGGGNYAITKENSAQMFERKKIIGNIAQMRALAKISGVDLPEDADLEEVAQAAGTGLEALYLHMAETFKESKNLRGMGETFAKLSTGFMDTDPQPITPPPPQTNVMVLIAQYVALKHEKPVDVIEVE